MDELKKNKLELAITGLELNNYKTQLEIYKLEEELDLEHRYWRIDRDQDAVGASVSIQ